VRSICFSSESILSICFGFSSFDRFVVFVLRRRHFEIALIRSFCLQVICIVCLSDVYCSFQWALPNVWQVNRQYRCAAPTAASRAFDMSQSWPLSQLVNKSNGTCSVCLATRQLHLRDGTVHRHVPRRHCPWRFVNSCLFQTGQAISCAFYLCVCIRLVPILLLSLAVRSSLLLSFASACRYCMCLLLVRHCLFDRSSAYITANLYI